jgi:hypothetical protein
MRRVWPWLILALCVAFAVAWPLGLQGWLACQTGTEAAKCPLQYGYWSGFGSVWPWAQLGLGGIVTAVLLHWRHINCHEPGCWRVGRYALAGGEFKVCGHHHPDWDGSTPSHEHLVERHRLYKAGRQLAR